jgi:hypothetical protein
MASKLRLGELSVVQGLPGDDHVSAISLGERPSAEPVSDCTWAATDEIVDSYAFHVNGSWK